MSAKIPAKLPSYQLTRDDNTDAEATMSVLAVSREENTVQQDLIRYIRTSLKEHLNFKLFAKNCGKPLNNKSHCVGSNLHRQGCVYNTTLFTLSIS